MRAFLLSACCLALVPGAARADVFTLGEIQVTAPQAEGPTVGGNAVSAEDIRLFNRDTVGRAVDLLPGVTLSKVGPRNEQMIYVRGFDLRQVPVLIDGIPVYVPYDGYVDLGRFTTFDLSEIQVSKGYASAINGPNTLGGAINLVSRRPSRAFEAEGFAGSSFDGSGAFNGMTTAATVGTKQTKWWAQASASYLDRDHFSLSEGFSGNRIENGGRRDNSYNSDAKLNLKLAYTPGSADEYALNYVYQHGRKGTPPYAGNDPATQPRYWRWPYWDKNSLYWLSTTQLGGSWYLKTRAFHDTFENSLYAYDDASYAGMVKKSSFKSWYDDYTVGGSVEVGGDLGRWHSVKTALHYKNDNHQEHNWGEPTRRFEDNTWSVAVEDTIHATRSLDVIAGLSYDMRETEAAQDYQRGRVFDFARADTASWNPQLATVWRFSGSGNAHASVSAKSRFPTIKDRYSYRMGTAIPNSDLKAERAINYEIGVSEQFWGHTRFEATAFHSDLSDIIQSVTLSPSLTQMRNVGDGHSRGLELGVRSLVLKNTELGAAYTLLDRANTSNNAVKLTDTPRHKLFAYAKYDATERVSLTPSAEWASARYVTTQGRKTDGYMLANFKAAWQVTDTFGAEAGINNLFDHNYELADGFPEEGRNYFLNARVKF